MKNNLFKRIAVMLLAIVMLLSVCGCGDKGDNNDSGDTEFAKIKNPKTNVEVVDLKGYEFTVAADWQYYDDVTGIDLIVSEQVWQARREEVEQLYNCKIKVIPVPDNYSAKILAGEKVADIVQFDLSDLYSVINAGYLRPLDSIEGINVKDELWSGAGKYIELATHEGRPYALSYAVPQEVRGGMVYNKTLLKKLGINEDIPQLVRDGKWTFDKFLELAKACTVDSNGDGIPESYGVMSQSGDKLCSDFINANGGRMAILKDGKVIENFSDKAVVNGLTFVADLVNKHKVAYIPEQWLSEKTFMAGGYSQKDFVNSFVNGIAGFYMCETWVMNQLIKPVASNIEYGFVPMPKGPDTDEYSCDGHYMLGFAVTVNNKDLDKAVPIINALAQRPAGYEGDDWVDSAIELQFFQSGDTDSVEMYKMMYEVSNYDYMYGINLNALYQDALQPSVLWNKGTPATMLSSMRGTMQSYLDKVYNK